MKMKLPLALKSEMEAMERLAETASEYPEILKIVVFGSRVRGDFHGDSDFDLLIVVESLKNRDRVIRLIHELELEYDAPLSPTLYTQKEVEENKRLGSSFFGNVEREGVMIYDVGQR
jgi:predicted nucleotidyltransferase